MPTPTTLKIPEDLKTRLVALAQAEGMTAHAYMLEALREKAERAERRAQYVAAGEKALAAYERNGIAYAMEDVEPYILGLAAGRKPARPKPTRRSRKR